MEKELEYKNLIQSFVCRTVEKSNLNPFMRPFVHKRDNLFSINLKHTCIDLNRVITFINKNRKESNKDYVVLFVHLKKDKSDILDYTKLPENVFYVDKWINGFFTNYNYTLIRDYNVPKGLDPKKTKRITKKNNAFLSIKEMKRMPDMIICSDTVFCANVIREAKKQGIKVVAIVGCSANPESVDFHVIGNDNNTNSIRFLFNYIAKNIDVDVQEIPKEILNDENKEPVFNIQEEETPEAN